MAAVCVISSTWMSHPCHIIREIVRLTCCPQPIVIHTSFYCSQGMCTCAVPACILCCAAEPKVPVQVPFMLFCNMLQRCNTAVPQVRQVPRLP